MARATGKQSGANNVMYEVEIEARKVVQLMFTEAGKNGRTVNQGIRMSTKKTRGVYGIIRGDR